LKPYDNPVLNSGGKKSRRICTLACTGYVTKNNYQKYWPPSFMPAAKGSALESYLKLDKNMFKANLKYA
jgi:hypothetical protein